MGLTKEKSEHDIRNTHSSDTTWVCVNGLGYMHRHHEGVLMVAKVWRREEAGPKGLIY